MASRKNGSAKKQRATGANPGRRGSRKCDLEDICKYLKELSNYLKRFNADYTDLRIAVCNVEREAFKAKGESGETKLRFCTKKRLVEPQPPAPPPEWD